MACLLLQGAGKIGRKVVEESERDPDVWLLRADKPCQRGKGLRPARVTRAVGEQQQASFHGRAFTGTSRAS